MLIDEKVKKILDKLEGKPSSLKIITKENIKNLFLMRQSMTLFKDKLIKTLLGDLK